MPGAVTAIAIDRAAEFVVVGNTLGLVLIFDFAGDASGRAALPSPVQSVFVLSAGILVGLEDGSAHLLQRGDDGELDHVARWEVDAAWDRVAQTAEGLLIPTTGKILHLSL